MAQEKQCGPCLAPYQGKVCGYTWTKRIAGRPKACPECKSRTWDKPRPERE